MTKAREALFILGSHLLGAGSTAQESLADLRRALDALDSTTRRIEEMRSELADLRIELDTRKARDVDVRMVAVFTSVDADEVCAPHSRAAANRLLAEPWLKAGES